VRLATLAQPVAIWPFWWPRAFNPADPTADLLVVTLVFEPLRESEMTPRFYIAPTQQFVVVRRRPRTEISQMMR
jgi:hypothetical protein